MLVFGSISLGLYLWCGLVEFLRELGRFGKKDKKIE